MENLQRRDVLLSGAAAGILLLNRRGLAVGAQAGEQLIPWTDQPPPVPPPAQKSIHNLTGWEDLDSWITPKDKIFYITHYGVPQVDPASWQLDVLGQVEKPLRLTLGDLKARPRQEVTFTLECSGNNGFPFFTSAIGNARWAGASLAGILNAAQIKSGALEVVFFGVDHGEEVVHQGTPLEAKFTGNLARSMSIEEVMKPENILCYEMNGEPLPVEHG